MKVVAIKNIYLNIKGQTKIKEITKGKVYETLTLSYFSKNNDKYVVNDFNTIKLYKDKTFKSIEKNRDDKLTQLGI